MPTIRIYQKVKILKTNLNLQENLTDADSNLLQILQVDRDVQIEEEETFIQAILKHGTKNAKLEKELNKPSHLITNAIRRLRRKLAKKYNKTD